MRRLSQDICDDTYVCNQSTRLYAWVEYYRGLLNVEFPRERDTLSDAPPVEDSALGITNNMVHAALNKKKYAAKQLERELCLSQMPWLSGGSFHR